MIFNFDSKEEDARDNFVPDIENIENRLITPTPNYISPISQNNLFITKYQSRRGRYRKIIQNGRKVHGSDSYDNLLRKIQVHFLTFLVNFCNDALRTEYEYLDSSFKQINHYVKENIRNSLLIYLKKCSVRYILSLDISSKYKKINKDANRKLVEKIESSSTWLDRLFQMNYLQLFKYYYNDEKPLNKIYFMEREIFFTPNTKSFYCLLEKNKTLKWEILQVAKSNYLEENDNKI